MGCCGGHRQRCLFGVPHAWATWYEGGKLQRTRLTFYCCRCDGVCTAEEADLDIDDSGSCCHVTCPDCGSNGTHTYEEDGVLKMTAHRHPDLWPAQCGGSGTPVIRLASSDQTPSLADDLA